MTLGDVDAAIDALARDAAIETHIAIAEVTDGGQRYFEACNALSKRIATRLLDGTLGFGDADAAMNWLWARMLDQLSTANTALPEPAMAIYEAFDAGEFHHRDDEGFVDPVKKYTRPALELILSPRSEHHLD